MKILSAHDGGSGCAYYRMFTPLKELAKQDGYEVTFRNSNPNAEHTEDAYVSKEDYEANEVVVTQRSNSLEGLPFWNKQMRPGKASVYELDDDIWNITPDNFQAYDEYQDHPELAFSVERYMMASSLVTASSEHLANLVLDKAPGANVEVLPNYIPDWVLDLKNDSKDRRKRIGWFGGSSHGRDIEVTCAKPVQQFLQRHKDWDLYLGGMNFWRKFRTPKDRTFFTGWLHISDESRLYFRSIDYDIGICPLLDTTFNRSKTPIKALEMMSRGIPVVASDVEPYAKFIDHGVNGFLCKREHEWGKYLNLLANDDGLREEMSLNARAKAAENAISKHAHRWGRVYENALKGAY